MKKIGLFILFLLLSIPSFADDSPRMGFGELAEGQSLKFLTYNEMVRKLDAYVQCVVACATQTIPLTTEVVHKGDFYIPDSNTIVSVSSSFTGVRVGDILGFSGFTYSTTNDVSVMVSSIISVTEIQTYRTLKAESINYDATVTMSSPNEGDQYIVALYGDDDWYGKDYRIAQYYNGSWNFIIPQDGWNVWDVLGNRFLYYKQGEWVDLFQTVSVEDLETTNLNVSNLWPYFFGSFIDVYCPLSFNNGKGIWGAGYAEINCVTAEQSLRVPNIDTTARDAIPNPTGQVIFNTDRNLFQIYGATQWLEIQTTPAP